MLLKESEKQYEQLKGRLDAKMSERTEILSKISDCQEKLEAKKEEVGAPEAMYTSLSYPALLFGWLLTLTLINCDNIILLLDWLITLTLINCDNIIQEQSAGSKSGVYVDFYCAT